MGRKKLIVVGLDVFFADSFLWFRERGFEVTVLARTSHAPWFAKNAALYEDMGFRVIRYTPEAFWDNSFHFKELALDRETLILAGPNFEGDMPALSADLNGSTLYDLWLLQALAAYNRRQACGAMVARFHNGDTGFGSQEMADLYALGLRDVDFLLFDNDLLREFVLCNAPSLQGKPSALIWLEGPLKRHLRRNEGRGVDFICLGRFICGQRLNIPVLHFPLKRAGQYAGLARPVKRLYELVNAESLSALARDRAAFGEDLRGAVFGLDHLGGAFNGDQKLFESHKDFFFSPAGQHLARSGEPRELYWHACNRPSKVATYLMYGIIPVLPHTLHSVYRELADRKMAVTVNQPEDLERLAKMPGPEIEEFRENMYAQADLFTFDRQAERLIEGFGKFQAESKPLPASGDSGEGRVFDNLIRTRLARNGWAHLATDRPAAVERECFLSLPETAPPVRPWLDKWWVRLMRAASPTLVEAWLIAVSGAFDARYYFTQYPGLLKKRRNPILGYVRKGAREGRNPNAWFDTRKYVAEHPDAERRGLNPLVHYLYVHCPAQSHKRNR